ncbi:MAG: alpha-L-fucosidase [Tannerella sp.]|jgi:alpha-L-fucosidase|nr:alpha-L-fucosidase [Tannerella sp.]
MKVIHCFLVMMLFGALNGFGQENKRPPYQYPEEPEVLENLREWQDMKFGLFMHWGAYCQWGVIESWTLNPSDHEWIRRPKDRTYNQYVQDYENLIRTFNPVKFDPDKWAAAARDAGMRYVVFTTKHHDGFNMFDTRQSDYRITSEDCPFHRHPRANVAKEVFESFRGEDFKIGAYYSIADWHHDDYWWRHFPPKDAGLNYSVEKYPEKLERYNDFIYNQLEELMKGDYGKIDILWFDVTCYDAPWKRFATMVRSYQPQVMTVARGQNNLYENYRTPEQEIPEKALDYPWETCMTMGGQWSYKPDDTYKPAREIIQMLLQIVSRGGNYLLNIGPGPDGDWHPTAYERLKEIGAWMKVNSEAIYGTRPLAPYQETKRVFTAKGNTVYAAYLADENETNLPSLVMVHSMQPAKGSKVYLLGHDRPLAWEKVGNGFVIRVPKALQGKAPCRHAWVFRFEKNGELRMEN